MTGNPHSKNWTSAKMSAGDADLRIRVAGLDFEARLEELSAPLTCSAIRTLLPFTRKMIHCRWSGEGVWIPMAPWQLPWQKENSMTRPAPGQVLLYAAGLSDPELLIPYGECIFNSKFGVLSGNHVFTIARDLDSLADLGRRILWEGAKDCSIELLLEP